MDQLANGALDGSVPSDSLNILNDDCLHHIFSYIINIRERLRLMRVCKRFVELIQSGLKVDPVCLSLSTIMYRRELIDPKKQEAVKFKSSQIFGACHRIYEFHNEILDHTYDDGFLGFSGASVNGLSYVHKLILKSRYTRRTLESNSRIMESIDSDSAEFNWLLTRCTRLKVLHFIDFHLDSYVLKVIPETLTNLYLIDISVELTDFESFLATHGSNLQTFKYSRRTVIPLDSDRAIVNLISKYCPNLETLELNLSYPELIYFGSFQKLRYLSIEGTGRSTPFYEYVFQNCPNLTDVRLTFKVKPSDGLITRWKTNFPHLQSIQAMEEKLQFALCL